jgi:hypothetical protein
MKRLALFLAAVISLASGCVSVPMASREADAQAKTFKVPADKSNIYLYRNETFGGAIAMPVSLNGKVMGRTGPQTYFLWEVAPGKYEIASHTENTARLSLEVAAGRNYFVWQEVKMGMWVAASHLQEVSDEEGRKAVLECSRVTEE